MHAQAAARACIDQCGSPVTRAMSPPCSLTSWSSDGFGHQLAAALSCEALALQNTSYRYRVAEHTMLEHDPGRRETADLLDLLNHGSTQPVKVLRKKRYGCGCAADGRCAPPACVPGFVSVCDNCFGTVDMTTPEGEQLRARLAVSVRRRVKQRAPGRAGLQCQHRSDVCLHVRTMPPEWRDNDRCVWRPRLWVDEPRSTRKRDMGVRSVSEL